MTRPNQFNRLANNFPNNKISWLSFDFLVDDEAVFQVAQQQQQQQQRIALINDCHDQVVLSFFFILGSLKKKLSRTTTTRASEREREASDWILYIYTNSFPFPSSSYLFVACEEIVNILLPVSDDVSFLLLFSVLVFQNVLFFNIFCSFIIFFSNGAVWF